jgi:predicted GNAT family N-acyltransferase
MTNIKIIKTSTEKDMEGCFHIRTVVFIHEQNVPMDEEIDGLDKEADHYLLSTDDEPIATARVRFKGGVAKIERVAVLKSRRGLNIGRRLMEFIMADIMKNSDIKTLKLGAQIQAISFYEKLGFKSYGDEYLDANIRHIWMMREL